MFNVSMNQSGDDIFVTVRSVCNTNDKFAQVCPNPCIFFANFCTINAKVC